VAETRPELRLVIAGDDAGSGYLERVVQMAGSTGLAVNTGNESEGTRGAGISFVGEMRNEEKERLFGEADAFVLPSYSEGLPVVALEAMAHGLPVIVTTGCNLPEVSETGAGIEVGNTVEELAQAILNMLADDASRARFAANARRLVEERFAWPGIVGRVLAMYDDVLRQRAEEGGPAAEPGYCAES
jgi:poly(glycerol-phosphate) alpha-glucosyltransferase